MDIIESIRRRPAMYVGCTTSEGIEHLIGELVANAVDLFLVNKADHVTLKITDNSISIANNGPDYLLLRKIFVLIQMMQVFLDALPQQRYCQ